MVKEQEKEANQGNSSINQKKSRQEFFRENYQKNKERKKEQQRLRYYQKKEQAAKKAQQEKNQTAEYYEAESISILMSLKEWTELSAEKKKLWAEFCWTFKDFKKVWESDITNITSIMKLAETANNVVRDYWALARKEVKEKGKSWNSLSEKQQSKLIKFWGREKTRKENNFLTTSEQLDQQGKEQEKELEMRKFHEERGKIKCECWQCEVKQEFRKEIKQEQNKRKKAEQAERLRCEGCNKLVEELEEVSGVCSSCAEKYE